MAFVYNDVSIIAYCVPKLKIINFCYLLILNQLKTIYEKMAFVYNNFSIITFQNSNNINV